MVGSPEFDIGPDLPGGMRQVFVILSARDPARWSFWGPYRSRPGG